MSSNARAASASPQKVRCASSGTPNRNVDGVAQTALVFLYVTTVDGKASSLVIGLAPHEFDIRRRVNPR